MYRHAYQNRPKDCRSQRTQLCHPCEDAIAPFHIGTYMKPRPQEHTGWEAKLGYLGEPGISGASLPSYGLDNTGSTISHAHTKSHILLKSSAEFS